MTSLTSYA